MLDPNAIRTDWRPRRRHVRWFACVIAVALAPACDSGERAPSTRPTKGGVTSASAEGAASNATPASVGSEWRMFRGDDRNTGVTSERLTPPLRVRWRFSASANDAIVSTAAIANGVAYVGCESGAFLALDLATGKPRWTSATKEEAAIASSPCVADGRVYFGDEFGVLYWLDAKTGAALGTFEAGGEIISSPHVDNGRLVFASYDGVVYAIDTSGGAERWRFQTEAQIHSTVALMDDAVLAAGCDGALHVVGRSDGVEIRSIRYGAQTASAVAVAGDRAYLGTLGNEVICVDWRTGEIIWQYRDADREFPFQSSAALWKDLVIIGGRDKAVHALRQASGDEAWRFRARGRVDSSPVVSADIVYVGSDDGRLYALDAVSGRKRWDFEAGGAISASPAIGEGVLVIGTQDGVIYCLEPEQNSN